MSTVTNEGVAIAPGVVETIVYHAVMEVEGVDSIGNQPTDLLRSIFRNAPVGQGIYISTNDENELVIDIHVNVVYGRPVTELADEIRFAASSAVAGQVGMTVAEVNIYVDALRFAS